MTDTPIIYAIGDIHGEVDRLLRLHSLIHERHAFEWPERAMTLIHLGDYVDRGPDSYGVIEAIKLQESASHVRVINLRGNHEQMMIEGCADRSGNALNTWLANGGEDTMKSYANAGHVGVPKKHLNWLNKLPSIHVEAGPKLIFVHAGINPATYPDEREEVYLWTRTADFFATENWSNPALEDWTVVHGHTPTHNFFPEEAGETARRINIDTGAVFGGRLTAAIFAPDAPVRYIYA